MEKKLQYDGLFIKPGIQNGEGNTENAGGAGNVPVISGNFLEDSGECSKRFWGMFKENLKNVQEDFVECSKNFWRGQ